MWNTHTTERRNKDSYTQTAKDLYPTFNNDPTRIAIIISKPTTTKEITTLNKKKIKSTGEM